MQHSRRARAGNGCIVDLRSRARGRARATRQRNRRECRAAAAASCMAALDCHPQQFLGRVAGVAGLRQIDGVNQNRLVIGRADLEEVLRGANRHVLKTNRIYSSHSYASHSQIGLAPPW